MSVYDTKKVKSRILELEHNMYSRLQVAITVYNIKYGTDHVIADIVLDFDFGERQERLNNCEYPYKLFDNCTKKSTNYDKAGINERYARVIVDLDQALSENIGHVNYELQLHIARLDVYRRLMLDPADGKTEEYYAGYLMGYLDDAESYLKLLL